MSLTLSRYLVSLGHGTRKEAERIVRQRRVTTAAGVVLRDTDRYVHDDVFVDRTPLDAPPGSVVLLNKPAGYVCSLNDRPPMIYELLPANYPKRTPVMASIGRLDADTSGLLLVTDDGPLNHLLASPKSHVPKRYAMTLAEPLRGDEAELLASGTLLLKGETAPLLPAEFLATGERNADITVREGRYHQVRRMMAAIGNHVQALQRVALGPLVLGDLAEGHWRRLEAPEIDALRTVALEHKAIAKAAAKG
ncbi:pseudouridine synthase [Gemmatimonas groenlandica]|uniref:Pseudouridine synthase n=1 Tax=Gemmatimonas groenlandica TaxID=2732249 RepID=A0A6M4IHQ5_9BACT|nr:pseudouridine synthase [Gemmatimonas groenlandica]QJR34634.1 rRNA pseudouridine synthase [Gemmatimonas groenlandica]